ncbi:reductive dehalogenase [Dehalococcoides mccartyi]|uniref:reductive dehalogenase n=1 Tax=Dehalococcoides mccartyi TaxID=61435 RepID=UPI0004E035B3|nr:reductive dehalogenase [Dehalococcoides mccartyi]AII61457.1 dehalogenase [Dehalococcoides mccartyi CG5]AOV99955.1 reductive dehalogenase [Dehalococcoides mccartyi]
MSQFHSIVSRRDFMKGLGLVGAGVGAAGAANPVFHDIDEIASSSSSLQHNPWWVKDVDQPTTPIDWDVLKPGRVAYVGTGMFGGMGPDVLKYSRAETQKLMINYLKSEDPNWQPGANLLGVKSASTDPEYPDFAGDIKDNALATGSALLTAGVFPMEVIMATGGKYFSLTDHPEGWREVPYITQRGGTKWQGSPEEALKVVRAAARFYGFDDVQAIPVDEKFLKVMWGTKQMIISNAPTTFEFGDVDDFVCTPAVNPTNITIPNKCKWYLNFTCRQPGEVTRHAQSTTQNAAQTYSYANWIKTFKHVQDFLWGLGYISLDNIHGRFIPTGFTGTMCGAGELSRWSGILTPKFGNMTRVVHGVLTDLPLAETSPVNFGARKFCETCGICANSCPQGAIQQGEATWDARYAWENSGYLGWRNDMTLCNHCPVCQGVCPFNAFDKSGIHEIIKSTISATSLFNGFFTSMDKSFDYGRKPAAEWWDDPNQPVWGMDTTV